MKTVKLLKFHWMKKGKNNYKLMKHMKFVPHKGASLAAKFEVQNIKDNMALSKRQQSLKDWGNKDGEPSLVKIFCYR